MKRVVLDALAMMMLALGFARERNEHRIDALKAKLRLRRRWMLVGIAAFLLVAGIGGALTTVLGLPSIKASAGHWAVTAWFLDFSKERSVATHSMDITPPELTELMVLKGAGHYETGCRFCHGMPGEPQPRVPLHMTPHPPRLSEVVGEYDDAGLYYIVLHGLKFTGMPAWPSQERYDEVWPVVAFLRRLPELDEAGYRALVEGPPPKIEGAPELVTRACARCHGADGLGRGMGAFPKLAGQRPEYLRRSLIAYRENERHSGIMEPVAAELDDLEIAAVVNWYAALPPFGPTEPGQEVARGEQIALQGVKEKKIPACASCHGPGHEPRYPVYPKLAGQYADYLELQLRLFKEKRRGGTEFKNLMQLVANHLLSEEEMAAVARYYATVRPAEPRP